MELDSIIQTHVRYQENRPEFDPAAREKARIWIETIQNAPRSPEAIQVLMDSKEVAMNNAEDSKEIRHLDQEWSALRLLQGVVKHSENAGA
jgi:hypothetical protein